MTLTQQIHCVEGPIFREYSANPKLRTFDQNDDNGIANNAFLQFCAHAGLSVLKVAVSRDARTRLAFNDGDLLIHICPKAKVTSLREAVIYVLAEFVR